MGVRLLAAHDVGAIPRDVYIVLNWFEELKATVRNWDEVLPRIID